MHAQVFKSNKHQVWRVIYQGDILSEWENEEVARAYCNGYNAALTNNEEEETQNEKFN